MKRLKYYLVQPGYIYGESEQSAYLPYAAGTIAAYAGADDFLRQKTEFGGFICFFEDTEQVVCRLSDGDVIGFSNYVWNYSYNCEIAKRLKQIRPNCRIVFGGHQIAQNSALLSDLTYVDFFLFGEGEETFASLLKALCTDQSYETIDNMCFRSSSGELKYTPRKTYADSRYPSPYVQGIFEPLLAAYPDIHFTALFETNRGCPYQCAFCDWGTTADHIKAFPMERIEAEIRWIADHRIKSVFIADANFGMFARDEQITAWLIRSKEKTGCPEHVDVTFAKSSPDRTLRIVSALYRAGMTNGSSISFQSLNTDTLDAIGRKNISPDSFSTLLQQYEAVGLRPYTELILGLPLETYDSFKKGIGDLLRLGQHHYIDIFRCEILPNAALADPDIKEKYKIKTIRVPSTLHHVRADNVQMCRGFSDIVTETSAMPADDMLQANLFAMTVQSCHFMNLTRYVAVFLYRVLGVNYESFYQDWMEYIGKNPDNPIGRLFLHMRKTHENFLNNGQELSYLNPLFGNITWFPEEGFFLECVHDPDSFYALLHTFLKRYPLRECLRRELVDFQKFTLAAPDPMPQEMSFRFDFPGFFGTECCSIPEEKETVVSLRRTVYENSEVYARRVVWYGRRRGRSDDFLSGMSE